MKGSAYDMIYGSAMLLFLAIVILIGWFMYTSINSTGIFAGNAQAQAAFAQSGQTMGIFDGLFLLWIIGIGMGSLVSAAMIRSHPVYFIIFFFINIITYVLSAIFSNTFTSFTSSGAMATASASFPLMALGMQNFPIITLALSFLLAIFMFAKGGNQ